MTQLGPVNNRPHPSRSKSWHLPIEILRTLGAYIRGQLTVSAILACLYAIGFAILQVPAWPVVAFLCGLLNVIPIFGSLIALILGLGLTYTGTGDFTRVLMVMGVFVVVMTIEGYVVTPRILGRRLGLRPLYVFLAVLAGGALFGFFGLLLAVPALAVSNVVLKFFRDAEELKRTTTSRTAPPPPDLRPD